jgi:branched-chain amino acid transport system substrate-binding protein
MQEPNNASAMDRIGRHEMSLLARIALLALACVAPALLVPAPATAQVQGITNDTIKIGMHNSMTGPIAVFGLTYERVTRILFDKINAEGGINGRKIEFIVEDDRGDPGGGVAAVTKLIDRDKVFLVLGGAYTPVTLAAFPRVVEKNVIYWSPASSTPLLTEPFKRLTFQAQLPLDEHAIAVVKLAASMKPKKIAFIGENNEYGKVTHDAAVKELAKQNLKIDVDETIEPNTTSATTQIANIKASGADVILHGGTPKALAFIIREIYKQGVKAPLISFGGGSAASIFELVEGEAPIEYYAVSPLACELTQPCVAEFTAAWKARFPNEPPLVWTAQGYAAIQFFIEGLRLAGRDLTSDKVIQTFETMPEFKTPIIPYPMKFSSTSHRAIHGGYLDGFKDGKHYFFGDEIKR